MAAVAVSRPYLSWKIFIYSPGMSFGGGFLPSFSVQAYRARWTGGDAKPATDAALLDHLRRFVVRSDRVHLAARRANPADLADVRVHLGHEVRLEEIGRPRQLLRRGQHAAAATAAAADEDRLLRVLGLQHQPLAVGLLQQFQHLRLADRAGGCLFDHHRRRHAEHQAVLPFLGVPARLAGKFPALAADAVQRREGSRDWPRRTCGYRRNSRRRAPPRWTC